MRDHDEGDQVHTTGGFTMPHKPVPPRQHAPRGPVPASGDVPSYVRRSRLFFVLISTALCLLASLACAAFTSAPALALTVHEPTFQITETPVLDINEENKVGVPPDGYALVDSGDLWISGHIDGTKSYAVEKFNAATGAFISDPLFAENDSNSYGAIAIGHPAVGEPELYVSESAGVGVFSEAGASFGAAWSGAATPAKSFSASGIAVDGSAFGLDTGDVYVADQANNVVNVFEPQADHSEHYVTQLTGTGSEPTSLSPSEPFTHVEAIAVNDLNGDVIVEDNLAIDVFEPTSFDEYAFVRTLTPPSGASFGSGTPAGTAPVGVVSADDGEGDIYVANASGSGKGLVFEYDAAGEYIGYIEPHSNEVRAVAGDPETHGLFVSYNDGKIVQAYGPNVTIPDVTTEPPSGVGIRSAVFHGTVNPDGEGEAKCWFVWGTTPAFGNRTPCEPEGVAEGKTTVAVQAEPVGLHGDTTYYYRLQASNQAKGSNPGGTNPGEESQDQQFTTPGPGVPAAWSTNVRSTSVTLHGEIDPHGVATSYYFQYGRTTAYEDGDVPVAPGEQVGSGGSPVQVEQALEGLTAGTEYHYRLVAVSEVGGEPVSEESAGTFTTQTGGLAGLPDGREWELVSPEDKHGAALAGINEDHFSEAAADGASMVFNATIPTEGQPAGSGEITQVLATRTGSGWNDQDLDPSHSSATFALGADGYRIFSSNLEASVLQPVGNFEPALSATASEETAYLREGTGPYVPLVTHAQGHSDDTASPFVPFGESEDDGECVNGFQGYCGPLAEGASPDLEHIVVNSTVPLLEGQTNGLYEWTAGRLEPVSIPSEGVTLERPQLGGDAGDYTVTKHAVSDNGTRVFWSNNNGDGTLFLRDMGRGETLEIGGGFEGANAQGTLVFYGGQECEIPLDVKLECKPVLEAGGQPVHDGTVLATSEDGSWVYFLQEHNIYVRHGDAPAKLVAANAHNLKPREGEGIPLLNPQENPWRASPNGEWFAFMSDSRLTGYDNSDANSGTIVAEDRQQAEADRTRAVQEREKGTQAGNTAAHELEQEAAALEAVKVVDDEEVYLYSAASGRLVCASCNPTGARPTGAPATSFSLATYAVRWGAGVSIAATVPGWAPYRNTESVYDPRFLTDQGRLFFNAVEGLVPLDVNGQVDVYELEPPGVGSCTTGTRTGTDVYNPAAEGCVALLSNGESTEESVFQDASESGQDVFFLSSSKLTNQDLDNSLSMWDAQACSTESPCPPLLAAQPPACDTEASCKASPTPQPGIYGPPASATFNGPGNVTPVPVVKKVTKKKTVKCKKGKIRNKHGVCVKKSKAKTKSKKASYDRRAR
jgi:hypothetical protein